MLRATRRCACVSSKFNRMHYIHSISYDFRMRAVKFRAVCLVSFSISTFAIRFFDVQLQWRLREVVVIVAVVAVVILVVYLDFAFVYLHRKRTK